MKQTVTRLLSISLFALLFASGCHSNKQQAVVEAPPAYQPTPVSAPISLPATVAAAPKLTEVQDAVRRIFKDAAVIDNSHNPSFVAGDFNGDASEDIAIVVKPAKLEEMNQELPPWLLREPRVNHTKPVRLKILKDEKLLAVIHGFGDNSWRDPEATQTFVLKNVVGNDIKVQSGKEFVEANAGRKLPRPKGDLIGQNLQGTNGYLYFAVSTYAWYDPKTFNDAQDAPGVFHRARTMR